MLKKIIAVIDVAAGLYLVACMLGLVALSAYTSGILVLTAAYAAGSLVGQGVTALWKRG